MTVALSRHWRRLLEERVDEAVGFLGRAPGVHGFVVGGSIGRGEPWPMSDIDLLPIYQADTAPDGPPPELDGRRAELVDWWVGSGRGQALDLASLGFGFGEIGEAMAGGPDWIAARVSEKRWFHGLDKAYGGRVEVGGEAGGRVREFAEWVTRVRFHPTVVAARIAEWNRQADAAFAGARLHLTADPVQATYLLREAARAVRLVLIEGWGERLGAMGREWTRFERMAATRGRLDLATRIATVAGAGAAGAAQRAEGAPLWLRERIELCLEARLAVGEQVTADENARDQLAAYTLHVVRKRPELDGPWTASRDPLLERHLAELAAMR